jgi:LmbE family N-acetylglucosaminyl deacetylase
MKHEIDIGKIVLAPHLDDIVISLCGHLLKWGGDNIPIKSYNFFIVSNFMKEGFSDSATVSAIRKREEIKISEELNIDYTFLDYYESVIRGHQVMKDNIEYPNKFISELDQPVIDKAVKYIREIALNHPDYIFHVPAAIGNHVDHLCISQAAQIVIDEGLIKFFAFYEDLPYVYAREFPEDLINKYSLVSDDIGIDIGKKINYIRYYESQPVEEWLKQIIEYSNHLSEKHEYAERIWKQSI